MKNANGKVNSIRKNIQLEKKDVEDFDEKHSDTAQWYMEDVVGWRQILEESGLNSVGN